MEPTFSFDVIDSQSAFDIPEEAFTGKKSSNKGDSTPTIDPNAVKETQDEGEKIVTDPVPKEEPIDINSAFVAQQSGDGKTDKEGKEKESTEEGEANTDELDIFYNTFVEKGLLDKDEEYENSTDKEEAFIDLFNKRETKVKEDVYKQVASELGEEGGALIRHLRNGGSVEDFAQVYSDPLKNIDITKPDHQKAVIRQYYEKAGWDELDIDQEIKDIEDLGEDKMADKSKKMFAKIQQSHTEAQAQFERDQEAEEVSRKEAQTNFIKSINETLDKKDDLFGISIGKDPKVIQETKDYILKPKVRLDDGRIVSQFIADRIKNANNIDMYVLNAYLMKNGYKFDDIKRAEKTKATLGLKKQLEQSRKQPTVTTKGTTEAAEESQAARESTKSRLDWSKLFG